MNRTLKPLPDFSACAENWHGRGQGLLRMRAKHASVPVDVRKRSTGHYAGRHSVFLFTASNYFHGFMGAGAISLSHKKLTRFSRFKRRHLDFQ